MYQLPYALVLNVDVEYGIEYLLSWSVNMQILVLEKSFKSYTFHP